MLRFALVLFCVGFAVEARDRVGQLPVRVWQNMRPLPPYKGKIVGGHEVEPHSIPHQISFQYDSGFHFCGGSIYNDKTIITAAHCCDGQTAGVLRVVAGAHNIKVEESEQQKVQVSAIKMHRQYNPSTIENDICLIELASPLKFNNAVDKVEMPTRQYTAGTMGTVSGWGTTSAGGSSPDKLRAVDVPITTDEYCRDAYGQSAIYDSMICAGEGGKDSCQGDSGGPMTCEGQHCGIVSWGISCADSRYPGVYTETWYFVDWINDNAV